MDYAMGCRLPVDDWVWLNRIGAFQYSSLRRYVSPFPPPELMQNVSGLINEKDFASHGADFYIALSQASSIPLSQYESVLDFGCGCGRLARLFKGHPGEVHGCDIDYRHIEWVRQNLTFMNAELTVHGEQALTRAISEPSIREMLWMEEDHFQRARREFAHGKHAFILQRGHLTTIDSEKSASQNNAIIEEPFEYGITFIPESYIKDHWGRWFDVVDYRHGALHSFQDIVVLRPKKGGTR